MTRETKPGLFIVVGDPAFAQIANPVTATEEDRMERSKEQRRIYDALKEFKQEVRPFIVMIGLGTAYAWRTIDNHAWVCAKQMGYGINEIKTKRQGSALKQTIDLAEWHKANDSMVVIGVFSNDPEASPKTMKVVHEFVQREFDVRVY